VSLRRTRNLAKATSFARVDLKKGESVLFLHLVNFAALSDGGEEGVDGITALSHRQEPVGQDFVRVR
jgi:hypothetical protein